MKIIVAASRFIIIRVKAPGEGVEGQGRRFLRDSGQEVMAKASRWRGQFSPHSQVLSKEGGRRVISKHDSDTVQGV